MIRLKVFVTVKAYPLPSKSYDELVCTAGILENGSWIRIYPVKFSTIRFKKYQWIELNLKRRDDRDFRPESYSPVDPDLSDINLLNVVGTKNYWAERKNICLVNVYSSLKQLLNDSKEPTNVSLATFKAKEISDFIIEHDEKEWKNSWVEKRKQGDFFSKNKSINTTTIRKLPYKFKYAFVDEDNKKSKMMIEDWEIGALFWNCLARANGDEKEAIEKVKQKYWDDFVNKKDMYLFLGTTLKFHQRRFSNPFVIIGVFYPPSDPQEKQISIF